MASPSEIGKVIRRARKARGLRQDDLAQQIGVHSNRISVWENGHFVRIDDDNREQLARILNLDPDELDADRSANAALEALAWKLDEALAEVAESQRTIAREIHRIQQGLELAGIQLPRDVVQEGGP